MKPRVRQITLEEWEVRYAELKAAGLEEPFYGGPLGRHVREGDLRLPNLKFDPSHQALRLWNFLLTEEERLYAARERGWTIVGTMKDLGTIPVMAYSLPKTLAFYPDGAWWIPCVMELSAGLLEAADALGVGESFCPVRAMLGAFLQDAHFPNPDLLTCSVGAVCDDFSAVAQRLNGLGFPVLWWEIPYRRKPDPGEEEVDLPGGVRAPRSQVEFVRGELERVGEHLEEVTGEALTPARLAAGIRSANLVRRTMGEIRRMVFTAPACPLPALELLIAEMIVIHFCSDREEAAAVLGDLEGLVRERVEKGLGILPEGAVRLFWVNPVADLRVMNLMEECGARLCGTDFLFPHGLDPIDEALPPMEALARAALADPMVGPGRERAERIAREARNLGAEAVLVSRIPGASHCAREGEVIGRVVEKNLGLPVVEIEVPPLADALLPAIRNRMEALVEAVLQRRRN